MLKSHVTQCIRKFELNIIKIINWQLTLKSALRPAEGCAQWFSGVTGQIKSFNFGTEVLPGTEYALEFL